MIPLSVVTSYRNALATLSKTAIGEFDKIWNSVNSLEPDEARDLMLTFVPALVDKYGNAAAYVSTDFYDEIRYSQTNKAYNTILAPNVSIEQIESSIRYAARHLYSGTPESMATYLRGVIDVDVKQAARDTILLNASKDPLRPRFARVPTGPTTCRFCLMLASRGFVYWTEKTAGALGQFHSMCDCQIVPGFEGRNAIEGYDPVALYAHYLDNLKAEFSNRQSEVFKRGERVYKQSESPFESVGDMSAYLKKANSLDDLAERCEVVTFYWNQNTYSDKYWRLVGQTAQDMRRKLSQ